MMPSPQTHLFSAATRAAFAAAVFTRSAHGNRQGLRLDHDGPGFAAPDQLNVVSDLIGPGDVQMTGQGVPFLLLAEGQTMGGYPRIGTVIPADLPLAAQCPAGTSLQFRFVALDQADAALAARGGAAGGLCAGRCNRCCATRIDIADLLSYQLIGGVTAGDDLED